MTGLYVTDKNNRVLNTILGIRLRQAIVRSQRRTPFQNIKVLCVNLFKKNL